MTSRDRAGSSRLADAFTVVTIVALGVCVAAVLERGDTMAGSTDPAPVADTFRGVDTPAGAVFRTPDVPYPTTVPGCETVDPAPERALFGEITTSLDSYDNPQAPWYSGPKSVVMTDAVRDGLPADSAPAFASPSQSLVFQPIPSTAGAPARATATAEVERSVRVGLLTIGVSRRDGGVPPCVAGAVRNRELAVDGTVIDTNESWFESGGERTEYRTVTVYATDGTTVEATVSDARQFGSDAEGERTLVLSVEESTTLAERPELRVSSPVPPETPLPRRGCAESVGLDGSSRGVDENRIDEATTSRLNAVLAGVQVDAALEPRLDSLAPVDLDPSAVCTSVDLAGTSARVTVSVTGGREVPTRADVYDPDYRSAPKTFETIGDGAVLTVADSRYVVQSELSEPAVDTREGLRQVVTVTYPSGTQVRVESNAVEPSMPMSESDMRAIATADGLDAL